MPPRVIALDDTDPRIQYVGQWFLDQGSRDGVGVFGPTQNHTLHGTESHGSFSFSFQGSMIIVWGTNNRVNTSDGLDPQYECYVDNISISLNPGIEDSNNQVLCNAYLDDGSHQLTVNATSATGQPFWFDTLHYTPSSSVSEQNAQIIVESQDAGIVYSPGWEPLGPNADMTSTQGAQCTFNFTGTRLTWVGRIPSDKPHNSSSATYSIDGGDQVPFLLPGLAADAQDTLLNQFFFSTPVLPAGPHGVQVVHDGTTQQTPLTLDYLIVAVTSSAAGSNSSSTSTTTSVSTAGFSPATTSVADGTTSTSDSSGPSTGAIVGGVVGAVVLVVVIVGFFIFRQRRNKRMGTGLSTFEHQREPQPELPRPLLAHEPHRKPPLSLGTSSGILHEDSGVRVPDQGAVEHRDSGMPSSSQHLPPRYSP